MDENQRATRILMVDDDALLRRATGQILANAGYTVIEAATGLAGIARAQADQPDLILLDLMLPDINGSEVCRRLKADPTTAHFHILVITAYDADSTYRTAVLEAGADGYVLRPIPNRELVARIEALLRLKRVEDDLRRAEARYREMYEHAVMGVFQSTPDGRFISVNPAMARIYGYASPAEMIECVGDQIATRVHCGQASRGAFIAALRQADILTGFEALNRCKDGSLIWTRTNARTVRDASGAVQYFEGFVEDITRRKRLEGLILLQRDLGTLLAEAEDLEDVLKGVLETACRIAGIDCGGVYLTDPSTGALDLALHCGLSPGFINAVRHYGATSPPVQVISAGQPIYTHAHLISDALEPSLAAEGLRALALLPIVRNGRMVAFLNLASHTQDELPADTRVALETIAAQVGGALVRLRALTALRESEERFRALYEQAPVGYQSLDSDGFILEVNQVWLDELGYTRDQVIGKWFGDFLVPDQVALFRQRFPTFKTAGAAHGVEFEMVRRDGTRVTMSIDGRIGHDACGRFQRTHCVLHDITERKRAEAARARQAEELERSNKELEGFAYAASHDLQEPLRMVASFVGLLKERYRGQLDSDADEFIAFAVDGAKRMQRLIDDLLEYSRVATRGQPPQPTDAEAALDEALWNLTLAIEEAGATVTHDPLPTVLADPTQLMQLFQNLIGNALKFRGSEPPRVHVSARQMDDVRATMDDVRATMDNVRSTMDDVRSTMDDVGLLDDKAASPIVHRTSNIVHPPSGWVFSVRDNGIGIAAEDFERIFGVFQRLHARAEYPGSGIGLAVCQKIVERHGGRIWVESQPGAGATFYFTVPAG